MSHGPRKPLLCSTVCSAVTVLRLTLVVPVKFVGGIRPSMLPVLFSDSKLCATASTSQQAFLRSIIGTPDFQCREFGADSPSHSSVREPADTTSDFRMTYCDTMNSINLYKSRTNILCPRRAH